MSPILVNTWLEAKQQQYSVLAFATLCPYIKYAAPINDAYV
jgi:hypothetical protein